MASKCKFPYILTVRLRARKPTIKIVGFLARKFDKLAKIGSINWKTSRLPPIIIQAPCQAPETPPEVPTSKKGDPFGCKCRVMFFTFAIFRVPPINEDIANL